MSASVVDDVEGRDSSDPPRQVLEAGKSSLRTEDLNLELIYQTEEREP